VYVSGTPAAAILAPSAGQHSHTAFIRPSR